MVRNRRVAAGAVHLARAVHQASRPGSPSLVARLRAVPRLVRAVRSGEYTGMSSMQLAMVLAGVGYVVSPIDLVPEGFLLAVGLVDDVLVIGWLAMTLVRETEDFIAWEQGHAPGQTHGPGPQWRWSAHQGPPPQPSAAGQTVPSHVVPD